LKQRKEKLEEVDGVLKKVQDKLKEKTDALEKERKEKEELKGQL